VNPDLIVAARSATFGYPEIDVGLFPVIQPQGVAAIAHPSCDHRTKLRGTGEEHSCAAQALPADLHALH